MMTDKEFKQLKKLANAMRKNIKEIDDCGQWNETQEIRSLRTLLYNAETLRQLGYSILNRAGVD